jgi:hypothetical protein
MYMPERNLYLNSATVEHRQGQWYARCEFEESGQLKMKLEEEDEIIDGVEIFPMSDDEDGIAGVEIRPTSEENMENKHKTTKQTVPSNELVPMNSEDDVRQCVDKLCMGVEAIETKELIDELRLHLTSSDYI